MSAAKPRLDRRTLNQAAGWRLWCDIHCFEYQGLVKFLVKSDELPRVH